MKGKNTTNFRFLKDFRPELYKLALRMEADLLVTPVSMLAYATRFMEYILYDISKRNNYEVNRESGFVNNIYELIQQDFIEYSFGDLLIKAYHFRNTSIHNTDITKSLKEDRNMAFELNRRLFDIADIYYKTVTNNYEEHEYVEPKRPESPESKFPSTITKQEKHFDTCIICGKSTVRTKSNFCTECDNLLNYREALAKVITEKGTKALLKRDDFDYGLKNQMIEDLIVKNVLERVGNNFNILNDGLDEYFRLTDEFMEIDSFLDDFINGHVDNPFDSRFYLSEEYPCANVSKAIDEHYVGEVVKIMENGFSQEYALEHMDIGESIFENWYEDKKSEFIDGNNDNLFIRYNELLIKDLFRMIEKDGLLVADDDRVEFWAQHFDGFSQNLSRRLAKQKLKAFVELFRDNYSKRDALDQVGLSEEEFDEAISIHKALADEYFKEIGQRETLLFQYLEVDSLEESLKKCNLERKDCRSVEKLIEILQQRYLNCRLDSLSTSEVCETLAIDMKEVKSWLDDERFRDMYLNIRLELFRNATNDYKSRSEILGILEIDEDELDDYIAHGKSGDEKFIDYYDYFENVYYDNKFKTFLVEFRIKRNVNLALKKAEISQDELDSYLKSNDEYREEFFNLKIYYIVEYIIKKGKINPKFLKRMGMSKREYRDVKATVDEEVIKKQAELITEATINDEIVYTAAQEVNCDWRVVFDWIYMGSCGDERFERLADEYWAQAIPYIKRGNSLLKQGDSMGLLKHTIDPPELGEYDLEYWQKWGLLDKDIVIMDVEDIKEMIRFGEVKS